MQKKNDRCKKLVYIAAFVGQSISLFVGMWFFGKHPLFFLIPPFLMALLFYYIYHKLKMPTMRSYMSRQCVCAVSYYMFETIFTTKNEGKLLPPNDIGPILHLIGIVLMVSMALLPILPFCVVYRKRHNQ